MKRFLESAHCVFIGAVDAKMGMEFALTQKPDMIFLDIVMPGINGFAALRALRKNSRTRETPIIMMSGNEQAKAQFFGAHIGADDFMKKPFSRFEVFARIARLLDTEQVPRRPSSSDAPVQNAPEASPMSPTEEAVSQQTEQPQTEQAEIPKAETLHSPPLSRRAVRVARIVEAPATPEEPSDPPVLASVQTPEPPVAASQPAEPPAIAFQPIEPHIHEVQAVEEEPTEEEDLVVVPLEAQPEPSQEPAHPVSAQVVHISPPPAQELLHQSISPELLSRIARLAHLAQSDPEALKALVVLSAQLAAQYAAAASSQGVVTQTRATAT